MKKELGNPNKLRKINEMATTAITHIAISKNQNKEINKPITSR